MTLVYRYSVVYTLYIHRGDSVTHTQHILHWACVAYTNCIHHTYTCPADMVRIFTDYNCTVLDNNRQSGLSPRMVPEMSTGCMHMDTLHIHHIPYIVPVADMMGVADWAPGAFLLDLTNTPPGWSETMRWVSIPMLRQSNQSPPGTFGFAYGSSSQNKLETLGRSVGHGGHMCTRSTYTTLVYL